MISKQISKFVLIIALGGAIITTGCKAKSKVTKATDSSESVSQMANVGLAKNQLRQLLTDSNLSVSELEQKLNELKGQGIQDPEVLELIKQVEAKLEKSKSELKAKEEKSRSMSTSESAVISNLSSIAKAADFDTANSVIEDVLEKFESPNTPVLIIISEENGEKDYDKPTTIAKYLEYVKMQKRSELKIDEIARNADGKISRLVFRK